MDFDYDMCNYKCHNCKYMKKWKKRIVWRLIALITIILAAIVLLSCTLNFSITATTPIAPLDSIPPTEAVFPLAIPIASLIGGLLTSVVGTAVSQSLSKDTMKYQQELNQQGIDNANRYNLPINQLDRLRSAGLNPNLVYGNGTVAGLTSEGSASTNQGYKNVPLSLGVGEAIQSFQQNRQIDQNIYESQSRIALQGQQIRESMAREMKAEKEALAIDAGLPYIDEQIIANLENLRATTSYTSSREQLVEIEKNNAVELTKLYAAKTGLTYEQANTEIKRRFVMDAQAALYRSNIEVNSKELEKLADQILNIRQDTKNKELWYKMQDAEYNSRGALKQFLANHENWAIFYSILKDIFGGGIGVGFTHKF